MPKKIWDFESLPIRPVVDLCDWAAPRMDPYRSLGMRVGAPFVGGQIRYRKFFWTDQVEAVYAGSQKTWLAMYRRRRITAAENLHRDPLVPLLPFMPGFLVRFERPSWFPTLGLRRANKATQVSDRWKAAYPRLMENAKIAISKRAGRIPSVMEAQNSPIWHDVLLCAAQAGHGRGWTKNLPKISYFVLAKNKEFLGFIHGLDLGLIAGLTGTPLQDVPRKITEQVIEADSPLSIEVAVTDAMSIRVGRTTFQNRPTFAKLYSTDNERIADLQRLFKKYPDAAEGALMALYEIMNDRAAERAWGEYALEARALGEWLRPRIARHVWLALGVDILR